MCQHQLPIPNLEGSSAFCFNLLGFVSESHGYFRLQPNLSADAHNQDRECSQVLFGGLMECRGTPTEYPNTNSFPECIHCTPGNPPVGGIGVAATCPACRATQGPNSAPTAAPTIPSPVGSSTLPESWKSHLQQPGELLYCSTAAKLPRIQKIIKIMLAWKLQPADTHFTSLGTVLQTSALIQKSSCWSWLSDILLMFILPNFPAQLGWQAMLFPKP